ALAEAKKVATAPAGPAASFVIGDGTVTTGTLVSCTVTVKDPLPGSESESVAVHVTVVSSNEKKLPELGEQSAGMVPSSPSLASTASQLTFAPEDVVASATMSPGTLTVGVSATAAGVASRATATRTPAKTARPPRPRRFLIPTPHLRVVGARSRVKSDP